MRSFASLNSEMPAQNECRSSVPYSLFLQRVWEHPFLTPDTVKHRTDFFRHASFAVNGTEDLAEDKTLFLCCGGSVVWATDRSSDYDVVLCSQNAVRLKGFCSSYIGKLNFVAAVTTRFFDNEYVVFIHPSWPSIFLTPDAMVYGNLAECHRYRCEFVDEFFHMNEDGKQRIRNRFDAYFAEYFLGWPLWHFDETSKRFDRYATLVDRRIELVNNFWDPKRYSAALMSRLPGLGDSPADIRQKAIGLGLPVFDEVCAAILASKGVLDVSITSAYDATARENRYRSKNFVTHPHLL